jgi:hypothetical protein
MVSASRRFGFTFSSPRAFGLAASVNRRFRERPHLRSERRRQTTVSGSAAGGVVNHGKAAETRFNTVLIREPVEDDLAGLPAVTHKPNERYSTMSLKPRGQKGSTLTPACSLALPAAVPIACRAVVQARTPCFSSPAPGPVRCVLRHIVSCGGHGHCS